MTAWFRAFYLVLALYIGLSPGLAGAQIFVPVPFPQFAAAGGGKTLAFKGSETGNSSCTSPCTFNNGGSHYNIPAGMAHAVIFTESTGVTVSSGTLCGQTAVVNIQQGNTGSNIAILTANVAAGSATCDGVITFSSSPGRWGFGMYASTGLASTTANSTNSASCSSPCSAAVTTLSGGFVIAGGGNNGGNLPTWSVVTQDFATNIGPGNGMVTGASVTSTSAGTTTPSYTSAASFSTIAAAAF